MPVNRNMKRLTLGATAVVSAVLVAFLVIPSVGQNTKEAYLEEVRQEIIPAEGTETSYGIPLSLYSLPQFVEWWYTLVPAVESDPRYFDALNPLVAPCCDDNQAFQCCCENNGQACNIIRSGKGLAAHLIHDLDYSAEQVQASVLEWFKFARPDYYMAVEIRSRQQSPQYYGLTPYGSCYRGMCETPISEGGCGGMKELKEPAIESEES